MPRIDRNQPRRVRTTPSPSAKPKSALTEIAPLAAPTMAPKPLLRAPDVALWSERAEAFEKRAIEATSVDEKRALTKQAVSAWLQAASADIALAGAHTHGPQRNAFRAAGRWAELASDESERRVALGVRAVLDGNLDDARTHFDFVRDHGDFDERNHARAAVASIDDAKAALDLDAIVMNGANDDVIARLIEAHPRQALAFAAFTDDIALIKAAGRAQSRAHVHSVPQRALLLAHVHAKSGDVARARLELERVVRMKTSTPAQVRAAHRGLARLAIARGDFAEARTQLRKIGGGVVALAESDLLAREKKLDEARAVLDDAIAHATDDALIGALKAQKKSLPKGAKMDAMRALDVDNALDLASSARIPIATLLSAPSSSQHTDGDVSALAWLSRASLAFLDPIAMPIVDERTIGGLLAHLVVGKRGDPSRATRPPASLSLGLAVARRVVTHAPPTRTSTAMHAIARGAPNALASEVERALAPSSTNGVASIDDARAALAKLGFKSEAGSTSMTKDGATVAFDAFTIAATPSFHARVVVDNEEVGRTVHVGKLAFKDSEWRIFEQGFDEVIERYRRVLHTPQGERHTPISAEDVRALVSFGRPVDEIPERRRQLLDLAQLAKEARALLDAMKRDGKAPKGAMIFVEGIDAASKTTNGMNVKRVFEDAGFEGDWLSFKAPTDDERKQHWLDRYKAHAPKEGAVFLADRTFLGDYAYNPNATEAQMHAMAADIRAWQRDLEARGVVVIKLLFDPRLVDGQAPQHADDVLWRPMLTFGKREARALVARDILERRGATLDDDDRTALAAACFGPGYNDLKSFHEGAIAMERFRAFADATDDPSLIGGTWERIGTKERHDGRTHAYAALTKRLDAWSNAH